jgi:predicted phage replisome organizer
LADVKWIKITTDMFDNRKIKHLRRLPDGNNIVLIWVMLLTMAGRCNSNGMIFLTENIPYTPKMLADELDFEENTVKLALASLEQLNMVVTDQGFFTIAGWEEYQNVDRLAEIREYNRLAKQKSRAKQKALEAPSDEVKDMSRTCQPSQCTDIEIEKESDKEIDKKNSARQPSKADVDSFFESVWNLYPVKKGKGQVSDTKRKVLYKIGYEQMERAINRYLTELKKDASWRKPQNGSTFFNSGYVDYLDENYAPDQTVMGGRTEKLPEWFGRRELDEDERAAIQRMMSKDDQEEAEQLRKELQASFGRN